LVSVFYVICYITDVKPECHVGWFLWQIDPADDSGGRTAAAVDRDDCASKQK